MRRSKLVFAFAKYGNRFIVYNCKTMKEYSYCKGGFIPEFYNFKILYIVYYRYLKFFLYTEYVNRISGILSYMYRTPI